MYSLQICTHSFCVLVLQKDSLTLFFQCVRVLKWVFFLCVVHACCVFTVRCLCLGVVGIRNGVITDDSFDELAQPARTGLGLS